MVIFQMRDYVVKKEGFLELSLPCRSNMDPPTLAQIWFGCWDWWYHIHTEKVGYSIMSLSGEIGEVFQVGLRTVWESQSLHSLSFLTAPKEGTLGLSHQLAHMWDRRGGESCVVGRLSASIQNGVQVFLTVQARGRRRGTLIWRWTGKPWTLMTGDLRGWEAIKQQSPSTFKAAWWKRDAEYKRILVLDRCYLNDLLFWKQWLNSYYVLELWLSHCHQNICYWNSKRLLQTCKSRNITNLATPSTISHILVSRIT